MTTSTVWQNVETARLLPARDEAIITRLREASEQLDRLLLCAPGTLGEMRDCAGGQPRAASYAPNETSPSPWCWTHECDYSRCVADLDHLDACNIEVIQRPTDTTGEAGIGVDHAEGHRREYLRKAETIANAVEAMYQLAALYPSEAHEPTKPDDEAPEGWCTSCWRSNRYHQPIDIRPTGEPFYRGCCRWCGSYKQANGFLPSVEILAMRHRGQRITAGMVEQQAKREAAARTVNRKAKRTKIKGARRTIT